MQDKLNEVYQKMLKENYNNMTVGTTKTGELEGAEKAKPIEQQKTADNQVKSPEEGLSQEEVKKGGASANADTVKKEETVNDSFDITASKFEDLYKSVIGEDLDEMIGAEVVDAPEVEGDSFDDELGDFEDDSVSDETDIAVELRTMAERLTELADKYAELSVDSDIDVEDDDLEIDLEDSDEDEPKMESMKSEPEPKPAKATTQGPKMSKTVSGKLSSVGKKHAKSGMKGKFTGEPEALSSSSGTANKSGMTVKGSGPAHSKTATDAFDK